MLFAKFYFKIIMPVPENFSKNHNYQLTIMAPSTPPVPSSSSSSILEELIDSKGNDVTVPIEEQHLIIGSVVYSATNPETGCKRIRKLYGHVVDVLNNDHVVVNFAKGVEKKVSNDTLCQIGPEYTKLYYQHLNNRLSKNDTNPANIVPLKVGDVVSALIGDLDEYPSVDGSIKVERKREYGFVKEIIGNYVYLVSFVDIAERYITIDKLKKASEAFESFFKSEHQLTYTNKINAHKHQTLGVSSTSVHSTATLPKSINDKSITSETRSFSSSGAHVKKLVSVSNKNQYNPINAPSKLSLSKSSPSNKTIQHRTAIFPKSCIDNISDDQFISESNSFTSSEANVEELLSVSQKKSYKSTNTPAKLSISKRSQSNKRKNNASRNPIVTTTTSDHEPKTDMNNSTFIDGTSTNPIIIASDPLPNNNKQISINHSSISNKMNENLLKEYQSVPLFTFDEKHTNLISSFSHNLKVDDKFCNIPINIMFQVGSTWINRDSLRHCLNEYGAKKSWVVAYHDGAYISCTRRTRKSSKPTKNRPFVHGQLGCGCKFGLKLAATVFNEPNHQKNNPRKRPVFHEGPVIIKSFNYEHTNGCTPNQQQYEFVCSRVGKYISKIPIQVYWHLCSIMKKNSRSFLASSTIKSILTTSFPASHNINKNDIYHTRLRCLKLLPEFNKCEDYKKFETNLQNNSVFLKEVESDLQLQKDEAAEIRLELFNEMFNSNIETTDYEEDTFKFQDYLSVLSTRDKGFRYRCAIGPNGQVNGVVWQTASMRSNFERFGSYICIDAMMRELNTLNWPYFAITLNNEIGKVCVGCEALMCSERLEAYSFMLNSCFEMCPGRKKKDVLVVSGDGFFNQQLLLKWGLINAKFIFDYWHLFDSIFRKRFPNEGFFTMLEGNLRLMVNAFNEDSFFEAYNNAKRQLQNMNRRNIKAEEVLDKIASEKEYYVRYMTRKIPGNRYRRGSVASEQNHASVRALVFGDDNNQRYMEHMHVMIRDLFTRQKRHINDFNKDIWGMINERNIHLAQINVDDESIISSILREAILQLNFRSFDKLFRNQVLESVNYTTSIFVDIHGIERIQVQRINSTKSPRVFNHREERCSCEFRVSHLLMCRHELSIHKCFIIDKCDIQHHSRNQVTLSYNTGPQVIYNNEHQKTVLSSLIDTMQESEMDGKADTNESTNHYNSDDCNEDENTTFDIDNDNFEDDIDILNNNTNNDTLELDNQHPSYVPNTLSKSKLKEINNDIFNCYYSASKENKIAMGSMLILIRDFLKTRGDSNQCPKISNNLSEQQSQFENIIKCYNNAFQGDNLIFDNSSTTIPNQENLKSRKLKRHMTVRETHGRERAKKRRVRKPTCSFCGYGNHTRNNCDRKLQLENEFIVHKEIDDLIYYLENTVPVMDPVEHTEIFRNLKKMKVHLIVHNQIYAKVKPTGKYQRGMKISDFFYTVTLLSKDNASPTHKRIIVDGDELNSFINKLKTSENKHHPRYIYDDTRLPGKHPEPPFHYREFPSLSQQSNSIYSQEYYNDSYSQNERNLEPPGSYRM